MWACFKCIRIILLEGSVHQWCMFSSLKSDTFCVWAAVSGYIRTSTSTFLSYYKAYKWMWCTTLHSSSDNRITSCILLWESFGARGCIYLTYNSCKMMCTFDVGIWQWDSYFVLCTLFFNARLFYNHLTFFFLLAWWLKKIFILSPKCVQ